MSIKIGIATILAMAVLPIGARAQLTLTSAGTSAGFGISTVVNGLPTSGGFGPIGLTVNPAGKMLTYDLVNHTYYQFNDVDNQIFSNNLTAFSPGYVVKGLTVSGSTVFAANDSAGTVERVNSNGSFISTLVASAGSFLEGLVTDPADGGIWVGNASQLNKYNSATGVLMKSINISSSADGISISRNGDTVYAALNGSGVVQGFNTTSGAMVFNVSVPGGVDGTAAGTGTLSGYLYANTNSGQVYQLNLSTNASVLIASGGSRGDFVTVDPNGSLLLTQSDRIMRLTAPSGGGFGGTPEPGTTALVGGIAVVGGSLALRRKRRK